MLVNLCGAPSFSSSTEDFRTGLSFEKPHDLALANDSIFLHQSGRNPYRDCQRLGLRLPWKQAITTIRLSCTSKNIP